MDPDAERIEAALTQALADNHLPESFRASVRDMLSQDEDEWPYCCGGGCDPCVLTMHSAARRALYLLSIAP